ncbi:hypothetical protein PR048_017735 [Dryococelus australis]|uniref:Uncharacterized protein n=1 Tax=Dryococelus australis TaxID=614101 RepID=A0ABQ9HAE7_9NEOP|nr:hypothetical protein PR048_017735 [Dryococelus australis]
MKIEAKCACVKLPLLCLSTAVSGYGSANGLNQRVLYLFGQIGTTRGLPRSLEPIKVIEARMEQCQNERAGETGDPRENPPTNGIVRHDSHLQNPVTLLGIEPGSPFAGPLAKLAETPSQTRQLGMLSLVKRLHAIGIPFLEVPGPATRLFINLRTATTFRTTKRGGTVATRWTRIREGSGSIPRPAILVAVFHGFQNHSRPMLEWVPNKGHGFLPHSLFPAQLAPSLMTSLSPRRAAVVWRLEYLPSTYATPGGGRSRIFACGNRAGRCRWPAGFSQGSLPLHSGAAPYSPHFTLIGSQDLDVKSRPNLSTSLYRRRAYCEYQAPRRQLPFPAPAKGARPTLSCPRGGLTPADVPRIDRGRRLGVALRVGSEGIKGHSPPPCTPSIAGLDRDPAEHLPHPCTSSALVIHGDNVISRLGAPTLRLRRRLPGLWASADISQHLVTRTVFPPQVLSTPFTIIVLAEKQSNLGTLRLFTVNFGRTFNPIFSSVSGAVLHRQLLYFSLRLVDSAVIRDGEHCSDNHEVGKKTTLICINEPSQHLPAVISGKPWKTEIRMTKSVFELSSSQICKFTITRDGELYLRVCSLLEEPLGCLRVELSYHPPASFAISPSISPNIHLLSENGVAGALYDVDAVMLWRRWPEWWVPMCYIAVDGVYAILFGVDSYRHPLDVQTRIHGQLLTDGPTEAKIDCCSNAAITVARQTLRDGCDPNEKIRFCAFLPKADLQLELRFSFCPRRAAWRCSQFGDLHEANARLPKLISPPPPPSTIFLILTNARRACLRCDPLRVKGRRGAERRGERVVVKGQD